MVSADADSSARAHEHACADYAPSPSTCSTMPTTSEFSARPEKSALVDLKQGKIVFKQKPISFEKLSETMQEIVHFREMLSARMTQQQPPLDSVPQQYLPVVAKLAHESDKTIAALSKQIQKALVPSDDDELDSSDTGRAATILPLAAVTGAISATAVRVNYGIDSTSTGGVKPPASLCVWRWEVKEEVRKGEWLPAVVREKAEARIAERVEAKAALAALFAALPQEEREVLLSSKNGAGTKGPLKERVKTNALAPVPLVASTMPGVSDVEHKDASPVVASSSALKLPAKAKAREGSENATGGESETSPAKPGPGRPKKPIDPEKAAKEKERLERKAAKADKEMKERQEKDKARSIMANFFGKSAGASKSAVAPLNNASAVVGLVGPSLSPSAKGKGKATAADDKSEFERTFRPFVLKKGAEIAPANWFKERRDSEIRPRPRKTVGVAAVIVDVDAEDGLEPADPIVVEDDEDDSDVEMIVDDGLDGALTMSPRTRLAAILRTLPPAPAPLRPPRAPGLKTYAEHSVRSLLTQLTEAELADEPSRVRSLLLLLRSRTRIPAKALVFHDDARPGYFGTFTKHSRVVGARAPLVRDEVAHDYAVDSGAEWEEEEEGGEEVVQGDEDEGVDDDEDDSDLDSWLVDDDEDIGGEAPLRGPGGELVDPLADPSLTPPLPKPTPPKKRKGENAKEEGRAGGAGKRRRVVVPLVPFTKGPCYEKEVGRSTYAPFAAYRIQMFNDTPYPIDPFTFVSTALEDRKGEKQPIPSTSGQFAVPALPTRPSPAASTVAGASTSATPAHPKRAPGPVKRPFPDALLPALLARIDALATGSLISIVETVYTELRSHGVRKNAIEAKVREIGEKCAVRKVWVVRPAVAAAAAGLALNVVSAPAQVGGLVSM